MPLYIERHHDYVENHIFMLSDDVDNILKYMYS